MTTGRQFRVDPGGTLTGIVARRQDGRLLTVGRGPDPGPACWRLPVHLDEFALRPGSGGGKRRGGDGAVRRVRFHEPVTVSTLSRHRRVPPYGMADVGSGDVLVIEPPAAEAMARRRPNTPPASRRRDQ